MCGAVGPCGDRTLCTGTAVNDGVLTDHPIPRQVGGVRLGLVDRDGRSAVIVVNVIDLNRRRKLPKHVESAALCGTVLTGLG